MQTTKGVLLLILAAIVLGSGVNLVRPHPLPLRCLQPGAKPRAAAGTPAAEPLSMSLSELRDAPKEGIVIIDARSPLFFQAGHIPRAINLGRKDFARDFARVESTLRKATGQRLVVYCSDAECEDALLVARNLLRGGLKHVYIFKDGWKEWQEAGLPEEQG